jgi:integrase
MDMEQKEIGLSDRETDALAAHWADRGEDFYENSASSAPLVSPVFLPMTDTAHARHGEEDAAAQGFTTSGLNKLLAAWQQRIASDEALDLTPEEREKIQKMGLHALRHTMATLAVDGDVPLAVVRQTLGHASLTTTSLYLKTAEEKAAEAWKAWQTRSFTPS